MASSFPRTSRQLPSTSAFACLWSPLCPGPRGSRRRSNARIESALTPHLPRKSPFLPNSFPNNREPQMALDLPDGSACFIDANIFYYHFVETPRYSDLCTDFLARVSLGRITAFTSVHAIADAVHKIMVTEVAAHFSLNRAGLVTWLQNHPGR